MRMNKTLVLLSGFLLLSQTSITTVNAEITGNYAGITGNVGLLQFDSDFSEEAGLGGDAWTLGVEFGINVQQYFLFGIGANFLFLDDEQKVKQQVVDINEPDKGAFTAESSETGYSLSAYSGINYPFTDRLFGNTVIGYEYIDFDREIQDCTNCFSENVKIDAGFFLGIGGGIFLGENVQLKLQYKTFMEDDVDNQILLGISFLK